MRAFWALWIFALAEDRAIAANTDDFASSSFADCSRRSRGSEWKFRMLAQRPTRIVGGQDAEEGRHPWLVSVHWGDPARNVKARHVCGGGLLAAGWVLTAGHCVTLAPRGGQFVVLAGKRKLGVKEEAEQSRLVTQVFIHPEYKGTVAPCDIALLKLEEPLDLNPSVGTLSLPLPESIPRGEAMIAGWGSVGRTRVPEEPEVLQSAILPILDHEVCEQALRKSLRRDTNPLHPSNVCTGPLDGSKSACKGDSGGPLVTLNAFDQAEVVGVVSWGLFPCGGKNAPSVYTRVSAYVSWITGIMLNYS